MKTNLDWGAKKASKIDKPILLDLSKSSHSLCRIPPSIKLFVYFGVSKFQTPPFHNSLPLLNLLDQPLKGSDQLLRFTLRSLHRVIWDSLQRPEVVHDSLNLLQMPFDPQWNAYGVTAFPPECQPCQWDSRGVSLVLTFALSYTYTYTHKSYFDIMVPEMISLDNNWLTAVEKLEGTVSVWPRTWFLRKESQYLKSLLSKFTF